MDCKCCLEDLTAYLDGELSAEDSAHVQSHLEACVSCSNEWRSFRQAADFIESNARELGLSPASWNRVRARLPVSKSPGFWGLAFPMRWRIAMAALAGVVVLAFAHAWYRQAEQKSLDAYIAQYEKAREAGRSFRRVMANVDSGFASENPFAGNPFIEAKASLDLNPFRSEDQ